MIDEILASDETKKDFVILNISDMKLSTRTYNALTKNGIETIEDLIKLDEGILGIYLTTKAVEEVLLRMKELDLHFVSQSKAKEDKSIMSIWDMKLSTRTYNVLIRNGIETVQDLVRLDELRLRKYLEPKGVVEVLSRMRELDLHFVSQSKAKENKLLMSIWDMKLSIRTYNALTKNGIKTVGDLVRLDEETLLRMIYFGPKCLEEVVLRMKELDLHFVSESKTKEKKLLMSILDMKLSTKTYNSLTRSGIETIEDLIKLDEGRLGIYLSPKAVEEVVLRMKELDLHFVSKSEAKEDKLLMSIWDMKLSNRTYKALTRNGIKTVGDLRNLDEDSLIRMRRLGAKGVEEVLSRMKELNIRFISEDSLISENTYRDLNSNIQESEQQEPSDLEKLKIQRDELSRSAQSLKEQTDAAKELLASYEKLLNQGVQTQDNEKGK